MFAAQQSQIQVCGQGRHSPAYCSLNSSVICLYKPWSRRTSSGFPFFFRTWTRGRSFALMTYVQHSWKDVGRMSGSSVSKQ